MMYGEAMRFFAGVLLMAGAVSLMRSIQRTYLKGDSMMPFALLRISMAALAFTGAAVCMTAFTGFHSYIPAFAFSCFSLMAGVSLLRFYQGAGRDVK